MVLTTLLGVLAATTSDADARRRPRRRANMPTDWTWPPSRMMKNDGKRCLAHLDELGVVYERTKARRKIATPVIVPSMEIAGLKIEVKPGLGEGPWVMDCHMVEALADGGAAAILAAGATTIRFLQLFAYRNIRLRKRTLKVLSRHALGLAMDIGSFIDKDGKEHKVTVRNWRRGDAILRAAEQGLRDTGLFRTPLSPRNDPRSHYDHFHIEAKTGHERAHDDAEASLRRPRHPG